MGPRTDIFELSGLHLTVGEGRRLRLSVAIAACSLGGETYRVEPELLPVTLDVSRITGGGYSLRLRYQAAVRGPCMRCLGPAAPSFEIDAREVSQPGEGEDLVSPYVDREALDLTGWAREALVLTLPSVLLCREECRGLCPVCGVDLNQADPDHAHERPIDSRWAKLSELRLE